MTVIRPRPTSADGVRHTLAVGRAQVAAACGLLAAEHALRLALPLLLALAVNSLALPVYWGVLLLAGAGLMYLVFAAARPMVLARMVEQIEIDRATCGALQARDGRPDVSGFVTQAAAAQRLIALLQRRIPHAAYVAASLGGALLLLAWYDWVLCAAGMLMVAPAWMLQTARGRHGALLHRFLGEERQREKRVIRSAPAEKVRGYYQTVARLRLKLADCDALTLGVMQLFVLGLAIGVLLRIAVLQLSSGDLLAVFCYFLTLVLGLGALGGRNRPV